MGEAAKNASQKKCKPLPLFTPEYMKGVSAFTLRYFEELYTRLPSPSVIILDNYQDVPAESSLHEVILNALSILPQGISVVVISRNDPHPALIKLKVRQSMDVMDWNEIRLQENESAEIVRMRMPDKATPDTIEQLHAISDGWAAGLTLMTETMRKKELHPKLLGNYSQEEIFTFFAQEVFNGLDEKTQNFMLKIAFLPKMSAIMAEELTKETNAGRILAGLYKNNYFISEQFDPEPIYEFHALYRKFLASRAEDTFSPDELKDVRRSSAVILEKSSQTEAAVSLLRDAKDWEGIKNIILTHASEMIAQGRYNTLQKWLDTLPNETISDNSWLLYWKGSICLPMSPSASFPYFNQAFDIFQKQGEKIGAMLSASGVVSSIAFGFEDYTPLDHWYNVLNDLVEDIGVFPNDRIEAWVTSSIMTALALRESMLPKTAVWGERVLQLKDTPETIVPKTQALYHLYWYYAMKCGADEIQKALAELRRLSGTRDTHPLAKVTARLVEAMHYQETGMHSESLQAVFESLAIAKETGVHILDVSAQFQAISSYVNSNDWNGACEWIEKLAVSIEAYPPIQRIAFYLFRARMFYVQNKLEDAVKNALMAYELGGKYLGSPFITGLCHLVMAQVCHKGGRDDKALEFMDHVFTIAREHDNKRLLMYALKYEAHLAFDMNDEDKAFRSLEDWLSLGKKLSYQCFLDDPVVTRWLCGKALEAGIEVEYVQEIIRKRAFTMKEPPLHIDNWPWPVKIFTLGSFSLVLDSSPAKLSRKTQQKPLSLLSALVALGGKEVGSDQVMDMLWPDAEGDMAYQSLKTTLHRLRKLLNHPDAVQYHDGKMSLDNRICWVDAWSFINIIDQAEDLRRHGNHEQVFELMEKALSLYKGIFLENERDEWWLEPYREKLQGKYIKGILWMTKYLEDAQRWEDLSFYCEKSIELYPCAEDMYRRLMSCYHQLGKKEEVVAVYERLKKNLNQELDDTPSEETEALFKSFVR